MNKRKEHWDRVHGIGMRFTQMGDSLVESFLTEKIKSSSILDLGCGAGELSKKLVELGCQNVTGIDLSEVAIAAASKPPTAPGLSFMQSDLEVDTLYELLANNGQFKLVFCNLVYAFLEDKEKFLRNVASIMDRDGLLVVCAPLKEDVPEKPGICIEREEIMVPAEKTGFEVEERYPEEVGRRVFTLTRDRLVG